VRARLSVLIVSIAIAGPTFAQSTWSVFAPEDGGFSVELPASPERDPKKQGQYIAQSGLTTFIVEATPLDANMFQVIASRDRKGTAAILQATADAMIEGMKGTLRNSSTADVDGQPAMSLWFDNELKGSPMTAALRLVATDRYIYYVFGISPRGSTADIDRFLGSFRVVKDDPRAKSFTTVSFTDAVCGKIPPVPITFALPGDFTPRAVGQIEGGCLWGARDDLDRVTVDPAQGDFTALRRGVFRARVSTEVVCDPATGIFDQTDGTGEEGMRRAMAATGAEVITWRKGRIAGLPALQVVADIPGGRVYMLYLGNTKFNSNAMLVNYYHPTNRSPADDQLWARFVAGIQPAK